MKRVQIAEHSGFCFGVKRATDYIEALLAEGKPSRVIRTLGKLIHNESYTRSLEARGVYSMEAAEVPRLLAETDKAQEILLMIRTHGIPRETEAELRALAQQDSRLQIVDMTCPFVKRIHNIADQNTNEDTFFLLFGTEGHPEVTGILSYVHGKKAVVSSDTCLEEADLSDGISQKKVILAGQTTQNLKLFEKFQKKIEKLYTNAKIFGTICSVTEKRQTEAMALAQDSDAVIVIGGRTSSNTQKLYTLCRELCPNTVWVEEAAELRAEDFRHCKKITITAGASTPNGIIMEVYKTMATENFEQLLEESLKTLHTGETVHGIVTAIATNEIYVDLGTKVTGVIPREQITDDNTADLHKMFSVGEEITAFVIRVEDGKGTATLSKKRVDADKNWIEICNCYKENTTLEGTVTKAIKGGLLISLSGVEVFIPASQTGLPKDADISTLVGTTQKVKLIDLDERRKHAIASIKVILHAERKEKEAAAWAELEVGKHYNGIVKNFAPYGAFVDIGGVDGMVHNTELSWKRIKHPSQILTIGQEIDVFVKELDAEKKRISLGYKTQEMDPWYQFTKQYKVGDVAQAKIVNLMPFGAFAEIVGIEGGVDGLIHISKISHDRVEHPKDVLTIGQLVDVKITEIDDENRKLSLSMKALMEDTKRLEEQARREAEKAEKIAEAQAAAEEEAKLREEMAPYIVRTID